MVAYVYVCGYECTCDAIPAIFSIQTKLFGFNRSIKSTFVYRIINLGTITNPLDQFISWPFFWIKIRNFDLGIFKIFAWIFFFISILFYIYVDIWDLKSTRSYLVIYQLLEIFEIIVRELICRSELFWSELIRYILYFPVRYAIITIDMNKKRNVQWTKKKS